MSSKADSISWLMRRTAVYRDSEKGLTEVVEDLDDEGMCGAHQAAQKMKWMLKRVGVFWPAMLKDCFEYYKGCVLCQKFGKIQMVPASMLHPIIKLWPFRGWGLDFIGEIHPPSMSGHQFVLVAIDYFTKWV
jgi:hypothetical protein